MQGVAQGLDKALEIIDETIQKLLLKYHPQSFEASDNYSPYKLSGTTEERIGQILKTIKS